MEPPSRHPPTGQRHIKSFGFELNCQLCVSQRLTTLDKSHFYGLFGFIDGSSARLFLIHRQGSQALHQFGDFPGLAQKQGFGILKISGGTRS